MASDLDSGPPDEWWSLCHFLLSLPWVCFPSGCCSLLGWLSSVTVLCWVSTVSLGTPSMIMPVHSFLGCFRAGECLCADFPSLVHEYPFLSTVSSTRSQCLLDETSSTFSCISCTNIYQKVSVVGAMVLETNNGNMSSKDLLHDRDNVKEDPGIDYY
jgi:hypothetical protein